MLLPASAFAGAAFLVATDTVARVGDAELPVGIVTAFMGAPFFLVLLRRRLDIVVREEGERRRAVAVCGRRRPGDERPAEYDSTRSQHVTPSIVTVP